MKILAIETATEACSTALITGDVIISRFQLAPREHTKLILPMMDEVLEEANIELSELDAIAFSRGPGAFTGLRIAAGVAQGVALSIDKKVVPVSTLAALALQALFQNKKAEIIITALDARMGEVYWGIYSVHNESVQLEEEEKVTSPEDMLQVMLSYSGNNNVTAIGPGWDSYKDILFTKVKLSSSNISFIEMQYPRADAIATLALNILKTDKAVMPENAQPVYIRNKVAEKTKDRNSRHS